MSLAVSGVIMAPVPFVGPVLSGCGVWLCWMGRTGDLATGARICLWVNAVAFSAGVVITAWIVHRYW